MKNCILFFFITMMALTAQGQMKKGNVMIGASTNLNLLGAGTNGEYLSLGFSTVKYKDGPDETDKLLSLNLYPKVGYFIIDNLAVGLDVNIGFSSQKDGEDDSKSTNSVIGAGPFVRYYLSSGRIKPFLEVNSLFGSVKSKFEFDDEELEIKSNLRSIGGGVGIAIPVGDKFCFDGLLSYTNYALNTDDVSLLTSDFTINSIGLKLGFTVFLGRSSE